MNRSDTNNSPGIADKTVFLDEEVEPQVLSIIRNAKQYATFVTPYVRLWGHLQNAIDQAIGRGVRISFIVRTDEKPPLEDLEWLFDHKVKLYKLKDLHAKIYINESRVLISSMNITEHSTTNSLEFAMAVQSEKDAIAFRDYTSGLMRRAERLQLEQREEETRQAGTCIRCGREIDFDPAKPLCGDCYQSWADFGNEDYQENYCHSCGNPSQVTYSKPLCRACYQKDR